MARPKTPTTFNILRQLPHKTTKGQIIPGRGFNHAYPFGCQKNEYFCESVVMGVEESPSTTEITSLRLNQVKISHIMVEFVGQ